LFAYVGFLSSFNTFQYLLRGEEDTKFHNFNEKILQNNSLFLGINRRNKNVYILQWNFIFVVRKKNYKKEIALKFYRSETFITSSRTTTKNIINSYVFSFSFSIIAFVLLLLIFSTLSRWTFLFMNLFFHSTAAAADTFWISSEIYSWLVYIYFICEKNV
jgi:hypothetical protein